MTYRTEPITMWIDRRLALRASPIHGTGTFALDAISAGETLLWITGGLVYTAAAWQAGAVMIDPELYNEERLPDGQLIATPKSFHYYINHACEPNARDQSQHATWTHYIAIRDLHAGEEITADYYVYGEGRLDACACGSPRCRWVSHGQ